jgi:hypothetical protein
MFEHTYVIPNLALMIGAMIVIIEAQNLSKKIEIHALDNRDYQTDWGQNVLWENSL